EQCARLGLGTRGKRELLEQRLVGQPWLVEPLILIAHTALLRRAELLFFQQSWLDRSVLVVDRLGLRRFAEYSPTGGPGLFSDRRSLDLWERGRRGDWREGEAEQVALAGPARGRPWSAALEKVLENCSLELLERLVAVGAPLRPRLALELERAGRVVEAFQLCAAGDPDPSLGLALERTGQRLGKKIGRGIAPKARHTIPERSLRLRRAETVRGRPGWQTGEGSRVVEEAVILELAGAGIEAIHSENWLWTSIFALVFRDLYWLPVPEMLPGPYLLGPLDLGTPAFYQNRAEAIDTRLAQLRDLGVVAFLTGWQKETLAGLVDGEAALRVASRLPAALVARILGRLAKEGWASARGLPDLLIFGDGRRVEGLIPPTLATGVLLAEVKGPTDSLQDGQRVWLQYLRDGQENVELWHVTE
ncbi:MAG TPA: VRR-NUC domain-containing protein, partial [Myxococcota bacterium]|nr:VRR-NUC domain-containing protein [Myxococcota bacterium]